MPLAAGVSAPSAPVEMPAEARAARTLLRRIQAEELGAAADDVVLAEVAEDEVGAVAAEQRLAEWLEFSRR